jgi:hypothetical protein
MMKVVINTCYGGFGLSDLAKEQLPIGFDEYCLTVKERSHPSLIKVVEELGEAANGLCADLQVIEVDEDAINPRIENYDGMEWVAEGRTWGGKIREEE